MYYIQIFVCVFMPGTLSQSWDSYIDNLIAQSKDSSGSAHVDKACIIGLDGGAPWTTAWHANAMVLLPAEAVFIAKAFKTKDFSEFMAKGMRVNGIKYSFVREESGKLVMGRNDDNGLVLQASKTAIVIGRCLNGGSIGFAIKAVSVIAEYLELFGM